MANKERHYNYDLRAYQLRSLCLLEAIDKVCREHNIRYYIIAGTLLGAVRHKGFIPWDDDMDIALMRKDYDTLMEHSAEWLPEQFHIVSHENNCEQYSKYFAKIEDTTTTIVESVHLGYVGGIYMDIFALDDVPNNTFLRWVHYHKFMFSRKLLYFLYRDPYKHGKGPRSWWPRFVQWAFSKKKVHAWSQKILKEYYGKPNCDLVMNHDSGFRAYEKRIFQEPIRMEFEGVQCNAPCIPEGYLSVLYGNDYMTPPPEGKRVSHFHDYCDLDKPYKDFDIESLKSK